MVKLAAEVEEYNELDHRQPGNWASRYGGSAWVQIGIEFTYLVLMSSSRCVDQNANDSRPSTCWSLAPLLPALRRV